MSLFHQGASSANAIWSSLSDVFFDAFCYWLGFAWASLPIIVGCFIGFFILPFMKWLKKRKGGDS